MIYEYPSQDEWKELEKSLPLEELKINLNDFTKNGDSLNHFINNMEIDTWTMHLNNRVADTCRSYVELLYYYNKGIPDEEWYISPGTAGESIQYLPHFKEKHFYVKEQFDYYADIFYYKIFSAWDTIGHVINILYELDIKTKNVTFHSVIDNFGGQTTSRDRTLNC